MSALNKRQRPWVSGALTEAQLKELEFQASEHDKDDFFRIGSNNGWNNETLRSVWEWFEVLHAYPLEGTITGC